jgi:hypothetical protein
MAVSLAASRPPWQAGTPMRYGMTPKDAGMTALKRVSANTVEKRLLNWLLGATALVLAGQFTAYGRLKET